MDLTIIVAVSENNVIGVENRIPWHIKKDIKRFKKLTLEHPTVIMGRKTYESIPSKFRPLPKRKNIVLSSTLASEEGIYIARNMDEALELTDNKSSYVIGGEKVYDLFLPRVNKIELTRIHKNFKGDAFFPEIDWNDWKKIKSEGNLIENGTPYSFLTYVRK